MSNTPTDNFGNPPDLIIEPRWLLPMTDGLPVLEFQAVAIADGRIQQIAPTDRMRQTHPDIARIELPHHVVLPGLINAHGHAAMSLLRGLAEDLPLQAWLETRIWPAEAAHLNEQFVRDGTRLAMAEMLRAGITTFADMYFFPEIVAQEAINAGMRAALAIPVADFANPWSRDADAAIQQGLALRDQLRHEQLTSIMLGPHSTYTLNRAGWERVIMYAEELDLGIHTHLHENAEEIRQVMQQTGQRPIVWLRELGALGPRLQAVHATSLTRTEIEWFAEYGVQVIHCPHSNFKLVSGCAPVTELQRLGVNVALGTDSAASNNRLDILSEAHLATLSAKQLTSDATSLPAATALRMATVDGARALGLEKQTGSIRAGLWADLIAVDLAMPELQPVHQLYPLLVHGAASRGISHVWVAGRQLLEQGRLTTLELADLLSSASRWQLRIGS